MSSVRKIENIDSNVNISDVTDPTKKLQFIVSGVTTGNTRTLTIPDVDTTISGSDNTETLSNKTLDAPIIQNNITFDEATNDLIFAVADQTTSSPTVTIPDLTGTSGDMIISNASQTLTNKTLTSPVISTISNTGTLTLPTSTDTLVGRATTDTLTNKTLTAPVLNAVPTFSLDDTDSAFNLAIQSTSTITTADKTLTLDVNDANRTMGLGGNLTTAGDFTTSGAFALTLTQTGATNITTPTTGTLSTLAGSETLTNKTITSPIINQITTDGTEEVLIFADGGTAVNEFTMTNAATGVDPTLSATGGDTDIGIALETKGAGAVSIGSASATDSGILEIFDDTGGESASITVPTAITTGYTLTLPDGVGSSGQFLSTDGNNPATLTWASAGGDDLATVLGVGNTTGGNDIVMSGGTDTLNFIRTNNLILDAATIATADRTVTFPDPGGADSVVYLALAQTLTNKTLTAPIISTISNTGTLTLPTSTDTLVGRATTDTLTNKTLTAPVLNAVPTLSLDDTDSAFNLALVSTSTITTADKTLTLDVNDANRTIGLGGNLTTAGDFTTSGAFALTLTQTGATNVTLPTTGTLATLAGSETFTNKTITSPIINQITTDGTEEVLIFADAGTAVNEFTITNAATANNPQLSATGGDANVGIDLLTKGTGVFSFAAGDASTSAELRLEDNTGGQYIALTVPATVTNRTHTLPDLADDTIAVIAGAQTFTNKTLTSPVLTTPQINDTSLDHQYIFAVSELAADRTITLPLLAGNDTFVFEAFAQTLTNKTASDSTNTIGANEIRTTGSSVVVDTAAPPAVGQVLKATSATAATWQNENGGGSADYKDSVRAATTVNGTLATAYENGDTIDGVVLATSDRILIKDQSTGAENGIYVVQASGAPIRSADMGVGTSAGASVVFAEEGSANGDQGFLCTNNAGSDIVNTDALVFAVFTQTGAISGPGSSTDNAIVRWDGATGTAIQDSSVLISDTDSITGVVNFGMSGDILDANGNELINFTTTASAVNEISITNSATGNNAILGVTGEANRGMNITDSNSNELMILSSVASAVNEITITNAATGVGPTLSTTGETNVPLNIQAAGTGTINISAGSASTSGELRIEDNTGGQYVGITAAAATTSYTLTMPAAQGGSGEVLQNNGSGTLSWASAGGTISSQTATANADTSTTSTTYTVIDSMTITPGAGTYLVMFSSSANIATANATANYAIFNNGTVVQNTERSLSTGGGQTTGLHEALHSQSVETVTAGQAIDVRYLTDTGTFTVHERSLILIQLS